MSEEEKYTLDELLVKNPLSIQLNQKGVVMVGLSEEQIKQLAVYIIEEARKYDWPR